MEATATVAVMEEPMELAASVVDGDLHVPPLQPLAENGGECLAVAAVAPAPAAEASADGIQAYSFKSFATGLGLGRFVAALEAADLLGNYVDTCESPLTLFAPSDEAFSRLGNLPIDLQVLRELLCVHITLGSLSHAELLNTRSITTISQQTHHVVLADDGGPPRVLQVGSASLVETDVQLPDGRGVLHVIDSVMCCIRLLQHCRYEQVWNKTVRPSPKVGLAGEWRQRQDELHAILIHCDTWQPRFQGLRGSVVPLGGGGSTGEKTHKSFQDGTVHFTELLILEKPPEMSKKKRKKKEDEVGDGSTAIQPASVDGHQSSNYRIMFSLYRRFAAADGSTPAAVTPADPAGAVAGAVAGAPAGAGVAPPGKHLTFCMAPEDILIRNSFHMLSEAEKNSRRAEYKASDGSARGKSSGGRGRGSSSNLQLAGPLPVVTAMYEPAGSSNSAMAVVVPGGGMGGNMVAGRPQPPPELSALSVTAGPHCGGTSIWVQGAHFCGTTQVYIGGALAPQLGMVNENLLTFVSPPASSDGGDVTVDIMATNSDIFGAGHAPVFSNALRFTYSSGVPASGLPMVAMAPATADAAETQTAERALALLAQHAAPHMPVAGDENLLTSASLPRDQRLFATALAVVLGKQPGVAKAENGESPLDRRDDQSRTLLHYCAALKNAPAVELLLRAGASTTVQDAAGQTPLELARAFGWVQGETLLAPVAASTNGTTPMAGAAVAMIDETAAVSVVDASISMDATAEVQVAEVAPTTGAPEVGALLGLGVAP